MNQVVPENKEINFLINQIIVHGHDTKKSKYHVKCLIDPKKREVFAPEANTYPLDRRQGKNTNYFQIVQSDAKLCNNGEIQK